jgi:hypothetical protein
VSHQRARRPVARRRRRRRPFCFFPLLFFRLKGLKQKITKIEIVIDGCVCVYTWSHASFFWPSRGDDIDYMQRRPIPCKTARQFTKEKLLALWLFRNLIHFLGVKCQVEERPTADAGAHFSKV